MYRDGVWDTDLPKASKRVPIEFQKTGKMFPRISSVNVKTITPNTERNIK